MATVLETLLIELRADDSQLKAELAQIVAEATKAGNAIPPATKPGETAFKRLATEVKAGLLPLRDYQTALKSQERELTALVRTQARTSEEYAETARKLADVKTELASVSRELATQETLWTKLGGSATKLGGALTVGITAPIVALGAVGIKSAMDLEVFQKSLETLVGDAERAKVVFDELYEFDTQTTFSWPSLTKATTLLAAFGTEAEDLVPTLGRLGDISSAVQMDISELADTYGRMQVSGRVTMLELNQLMGRGIPIVQELAKQVGVSEAKIKEMASAGQLNFSMIEQSFRSMTSKGGQFFGMMDAQTDTTAGKWMNLRKEFEQVTDEIGFALLPTLDELIARARVAVEWFVNLDEETQSLVINLGLFAAATGPVLVGLGKILESSNKLIPVMRVLFSPGGLLVAGALAAVYGVGQLTGAWERQKSAAEQATEVIDAATDALDGLRTESNNTRDAFKDLKDATDKDGLHSAIKSMAETLEGDAKNAFVTLATQAINSGNDIGQVAEDVMRIFAEMRQESLDTKVATLTDLADTATALHNQNVARNQRAQADVQHLQAPPHRVLEMDSLRAQIAGYTGIDLSNQPHIQEMVSGLQRNLDILEGQYGRASAIAAEAATNVASSAQAANAAQVALSHAIAQQQQNLAFTEGRRDSPFITIPGATVADPHRPDSGGSGAATGGAREAAALFGSLEHARAKHTEAVKKLNRAVTEADQEAALEVVAHWDAAVKELEARFAADDVTAAAKLWTGRLVHEMAVGEKDASEVLALLEPKLADLLEDQAALFDARGFGTEAWDDLAAQVEVISDAIKVAKAEQESFRAAQEAATARYVTNISTRAIATAEDDPLGLQRAIETLEGDLDRLKEQEIALAVDGSLDDLLSLQNRIADVSTALTTLQALQLTTPGNRGLVWAQGFDEQLRQEQQEIEQVQQRIAAQQEAARRQAIRDAEKGIQDRTEAAAEAARFAPTSDDYAQQLREDADAKAVELAKERKAVIDAIAEREREIASLANLSRQDIADQAAEDANWKAYQRSERRTARAESTHLSAVGASHTEFQDLMRKYATGDKIIEDLGKELELASAKAELLGDSFDLPKEQMALVEAAIIQLIKLGFDPAGTAMQDLSEDFEGFAAAVKAVTDQEKRVKDFQRAVEEANDLLGLTPTRVTSVMETLQAYANTLDDDSEETQKLKAEIEELIAALIKLKAATEGPGTSLKQLATNLDAAASIGQGLGSVFTRATAEIAGGLNAIREANENLKLTDAERSLAKMAGAAQIINGLTTAVRGLTDASKDGGLDGNQVLDLVGGVATAGAEVIGTLTGIPGLGQVAAASFGLLTAVIGDLSDGLAEIDKQVEETSKRMPLLAKSTLEAFAAQYTRQVSRGGIAGSFGATKAELDQEAYDAAVNLANSFATTFASALRSANFDEAFDESFKDLFLDKLIEMFTLSDEIKDLIEEMVAFWNEAWKDGHWSEAEDAVWNDYLARGREIGREENQRYKDSGLIEEDKTGRKQRASGSRITDLTGPARDHFSDLLAPLANLGAQLTTLQDMRSLLAQYLPRLGSGNTAAALAQGTGGMTIHEVHLHEQITDIEDLYRALSTLAARKARGS